MISEKVDLCPSCRKSIMRRFYHLEGVPVHQNQPLLTQKEAINCTRGDIDLGFCDKCGFISNLAFDPSLIHYTPQYENAQGCSPTFYNYMLEIAKRHVLDYGLRGKTALEIGCGKGEYLKMLHDEGMCRCIGFDPSLNPEHIEVNPELELISELYSEKFAELHGDYMPCRHVIEHIPDPPEFLADIRRAIGNHPAVVYFETPHVGWVLENLTFWDIFYEHCSYWSPYAIAQVFSQAGFQVHAVRSQFCDQYLGLEATVNMPSRDLFLASNENPGRMADRLEYFNTNYHEKIQQLSDEIVRAQQEGERCVVWGAGAKGVTFLNLLKIPLETIGHVVDINPRKQELYIPGTGQEIVSPEALREILPKTIFIMNPIYASEAQNTVKELGLECRFVVL